MLKLLIIKLLVNSITIITSKVIKVLRVIIMVHYYLMDFLIKYLVKYVMVFHLNNNL